MSETKEKQHPVADSVYNNNFQELLDKFHKMIEGDPSPAEIETSFSNLKEETKNSTLTFNQQEAILARIKNYSEGTYGSTSKEHKVHKHVKQ